MKTDPNLPTILLADDDPEDRMLAAEALEESGIANPLHSVADGEELMNYLRSCATSETTSGPALPGLILLDLNMPRKDGREALAEIKHDPVFRKIPVVVLTTSKADEDILQTYDLGVNSFITKPVSFIALVDLMKSITSYWFDLVQLPPTSKHLV